MRQTIGLLGGLGPEASADFYKKIILFLQNRREIKSNTDYPHIILNSIPAPECFVKHNLKMYKEGLKTLEIAGADFIVIICNTAYTFLKELQHGIRIPILDLKDEVHKILNERKVESITVLASSRTIKSKLYTFPEIKSNDLSADDIKKLDQIILKYNSGIDKSEQVTVLKEIMKRYSEKSDSLLIACTELSEMTKQTEYKHIDTFDILLDATIKHWESS